MLSTESTKGSEEVETAREVDLDRKDGQRAE